MESLQVKLVVLGARSVGKTCLLIRYCCNEFPTEYTPSVFDNYSQQIIVKERPICLAYWEAYGQGQEDFERLRPLTYPQTDVFLFCFSLIDPDSYENICNDCFPDVSRHCPNTPIILVGTKLDLLEDEATLENLKQSNISPITTAEGVKLATEINAAAYKECSSLTGKGVKEVFEEAVIAVMNHKELPKKKSRCVLL